MKEEILDLVGGSAEEGYLEGRLLIAMPGMGDPRFERSVVYLCAHSAAGAMGLIINKPIDDLSFHDLMDQLDIPSNGRHDAQPILFGGPVETARGFVLHSKDYMQDATLPVGDDVAMTATVDILQALAMGQGPQCSLIALGYAGWSPGQLEDEIQANGWLHVDADEFLMFETDLDEIWTKAMLKIGFDVSMLSQEAGHA